MCDIPETLPDFNVSPFSHLIHSLRKNDFTVADLISLDPTEVARKCPLPLLDVRRLANALIAHMQKDLDMLPAAQSTSSDVLASTRQRATSDRATPRPSHALFIQTLDPDIDVLLGGGFPCGYVTEIVGESAVGKTQLLISLLLTAQLRPPCGVGKAAIYLSTEDPLNTARLEQMLLSHPFYAQLPKDEQPTFDHVHAMTIINLEQQQNLIEYQLPFAVDNFGAGLVIIDSVAANFRADRDTATPTGLMDRAADLSKLGSILRKLAVQKKIAVVVANQVSDRFAESLLIPTQDLMRSSSPASSTATPSQSSSRRSERDAKMTLDHQSRFFTGWGDKPASMQQDLKTPALGMAWANQIDARIVLKVDSQVSTSGSKRRRFMNVVFAPWTDQKEQSLEYSIEKHGIVAVKTAAVDAEHQELLDESLWDDDGNDEFP